ncbi:MAG: glycyl-tRNA synthetase [Thermomicrobiales bacterium]|nr:glycyl-tRNA synthetase [Thermomicrobiales bacterium]
MDKIVALCKRRGYVFPGSDIYGGLANTWDYGPLGVELKNNVKQLWWRTFVHRRRDMVGLDGGILMHPRVWEASGHVVNFNDPLVDCKTCKSRFRADHLIEDKLGKDDAAGKTPEEMSKIIREANMSCPVCGNRTLTDARQFNMMFRTTIGPVEETGVQVYLRPETAQAMFVQYKNILNTARVKLPFGIAQIGKAFRNEITPGNFIFRDIEFEQMEIEYFVKPDDDARAFEEWIAAMQRWVESIGLTAERVRIREHSKEELSHYSSRTIDFEYDFPNMGWKELYGLASRTDFDLSRHQEFSGQDLTYFDQEAGTRYLPHVIEPTFGVDRTLLVLLLDAYDEEATVDVNGKPDTRVVLRLSPKVAPYKAAILPLMKKPELADVARRLFDEIQTETPYLVDYDETGNIGKRYRRQDEAGTPFCFTVDYDTLQDLSVTVRDRDTTAQERIAIADVAEFLRARVG